MRLSTALLAFAFWLRLSVQAGPNGQVPGQNPVLNMCARWYHQSTIKSNVLYVDGGLETFVASNNQGKSPSRPHSTLLTLFEGAFNTTPIIGYNDHTIDVDMSQNWNWKTTISEVVINKTANPSTGTYPPIVAQAALYQGPLDGSKIYLYGGTASYINTSAETYQTPQSSQYPLWSFDVSSSTWDQYDLSSLSGGTVLWRPSDGASAEAPDQGLAFYLSGKVDNGSWYDDSVGDSTLAMPGMVALNFSEATLTATNVSTSDLSGGDARIGGAMQYIAGIGSQGILAVIGGGSASANDNTTMGSLVSLSTIDVFDIGSITPSGGGTWYQQNTTGNAPAPRRDFCLVAVSAPDNSSHQLLVYGGRNETTVFDDIYALSIPQFQWTQIYFNGKSPRWGHTCHLVSGREMVTVGGQQYFNVTQNCDWESKSVAIYDIPTVTWGSSFNSTPGPYQVPALVVTAIGGTANGSATMTKPQNGFSSSGLEKLFYPSLNSSASPTPTQTPVSSSAASISGGAIAGIVVGVVALVALVALAVWFGLKCRARRLARPPPPAEVGGEEVVEKDGYPHYKTNAEFDGKKQRVQPAEMSSAEDEAVARVWQGDPQEMP